MAMVVQLGKSNKKVIELHFKRADYMIYKICLDEVIFKQNNTRKTLRRPQNQKGLR